MSYLDKEELLAAEEPMSPRTPSKIKKKTSTVGLFLALQSDEKIAQILDKDHGPTQEGQLAIPDDSKDSSKSINDLEVPKNPPQSSQDLKKSMAERMFSKIEAGSIRGSIFNMAIMSLGSGCLNLPQKFAKMSLLMGCIDIVAAGLSAYTTLTLMAISSRKTKIYNYSRLVKEVYGKWMALFLDITMMIYVFGVMILYQVISISVIF
jgi:hypothetical protein